jgi:ribosomal protein S18 acetylase RimI-like enzyme
MTGIEIVDVLDGDSFGLVPPCADPGFDHRSCDYWEDAARGSKAARASWLPGRVPESNAPTAPDAAVNPFEPAGRPRNPFAPAKRSGEGSNPFASAGTGLADNPFARRDDDEAANAFRARPRSAAAMPDDAPPKLRLLGRGLAVFGSYAKVLRVDGEAAAYCQFGPLTAYPRAQRLRDLYPTLPQSPLPSVITCIATTAAGRDRGLAARLVDAVCDDLAGRGFVAVEAYPEVGAREDATSAATPSFWMAAGFSVAADDPRFPVMRRDLV